jgi:hypothetical protein
VRNTTLVFSILAASSIASASSTVIVTFTNLNSDVLGNGTTNSQSNTYNGETNATIAGIPSQYLVCDDFSNSTDVPSGPIDFSVNTIASLTSSNVDFAGGFVTGLTGEASGGMTQTQAYDTLAVLLTNLETAGNTVQQVTDYQFAMWNLTEPNGVDGNDSSITDNPLDANASNDLQSAFTAVTAATPSSAVIADENSLLIYTPTSSFSSNQEFLGLDTPGSPIPEPSTWFLTAALGLLLCIPRVRARLHAVLNLN